jgi:DNA-binding winged helix-turn-helix (wHTH) protein/TolB-like protein
MSGRLSFGAFEFSPASGELFRAGRRVKLQAQPARVLSVLVANPGQVVSRETLQREVWGAETHVDFERGLNYCVAQVRTALGDSAEAPRYVATVPKQGYRFIAPVGIVGETAPELFAAASEPEPSEAGTRRALALTLGQIATGLLLVALVGSYGWSLSARRSAPPTVVVVPFYNETGRPELGPLAKALGDATVARLAAPERLAILSVIGNAEKLRQPFARGELLEVARELRARWVVIGQLKGDGDRLRVIAHLIRAGDLKHVWADTFDDPAYSLDAQARTAESIAAAVSQAVARD